MEKVELRIMNNGSSSPSEKIADFTDLYAWKVGHELVLMIYKTTQSFPSDEKFGLTNQLRRASVSITSNIAEGFGRRSYKDKIRFYDIAHGSLLEVKNQLLIAHDTGMFPKNEYEKVKELADEAHKLPQGLIGASKKRVNIKI